MRTVAVLGGGNGAHAVAADLSSRGFKVNLFSLFSKELQPLREQGGILLEDDQGERMVPIHRICSSMEEALAQAELAVVTVPAFAHEPYAMACLPHLKDGQVVVLNPGSTGGALAFRRNLKEKGSHVKVSICETNTLTYICRLTRPGKVKVTVRTKTLFAALPGKNTGMCLQIFRELFPGTVERKNVLETSLTNFNAVMHAPGMILNAGWIEFTKGDFSYYCEGTTPAVGRVIERVDEERIALCQRVGYATEPFLDFFYKAGSTTEAGYRSRSVYGALQASEPNRFIRAPENLSYRFLTEDVPYGIVPMAYLGSLVNVPTPVIRSLVDLASAISERNYWETGWTPEKMGIEGMGAERLLEFVHQG
jgi:opine dehydrogenase